MKKNIFLSIVFIFLAYASSFNAYASCDVEEKEKINCAQKCEKCEIDDDEYCIYNQCYFDKQYREMKKALCLTKNQEVKIDNIYRNFKNDYECLYNNYKIIKNNLLEMIACNGCKKDIKIQKNRLKEVRENIKAKFQDYKDDLKEELCKSQRKDLKKFFKKEKKKMKKIIKYAPIYKLPCGNCSRCD